MRCKQPRYDVKSQDSERPLTLPPAKASWSIFWWKIFDPRLRIYTRHNLRERNSARARPTPGSRDFFFGKFLW